MAGKKGNNYQESQGLEQDPAKKQLTEEDVYAIVQTLLLDSQQLIRIKSGWMQSRNYANNSEGWRMDANGGAEMKVISLVNLAANPAGPSEVGDLCCVLTKLKICTVAGTPGTWVIVGTQT